MKKRITAAVLAVAAMIIIPLTMVKNNALAESGELFITDSGKNYELCEAILYEYKEEYSEQGLKALGIILNSYLKADKKPKAMDKKTFIKKYGKDNYSKLEKLSDSISSEYIEYRGKPIAVDYSYLSKGGGKYYLADCAYPWDRLKTDYNKAKTGLSLNSINTLCKIGLTAEEAITNFLKSDIKIINSKSNKRAAAKR